MTNIPILHTDTEFNLLAPPLSPKQTKELKKELLTQGCTKAMYVWEEILLVGYDAYQICIENNIPYPRFNMAFSTRNDAIAWTCAYHLKENNLEESMKRYLIGKHYEIEKKTQRLEIQNSGCEKLSGHIYHTALMIGKEYHLAQNTIYKYGIFAHCIDDIASKDSQIVRRIFQGTLHISQENVIELSHLPKEDIQSISQSLSDNHTEHIGYSEMRHELIWKKIPISTKSKITSVQDDIPIKKLPEYNPDSTISSLALTIPSWISSIERTRSIGDFRNISNNARSKLLYQLMQLKNTINDIITVVKEETHG